MIIKVAYNLFKKLSIIIIAQDFLFNFLRVILPPLTKQVFKLKCDLSYQVEPFLWE